MNSLSGLALVGFQGYMAASCNFGQARGWAYASDGANVNEDSQSAEIIVTPRSSAALTTLLFSAANSTTGVDTATTISNTSQDPFSSTSASGSCTLSYYGDTSGGGTPSPQTSSAVAPGGQLSFSLAQGNPLQGIAPVTGFNGYVIASCGFPLARGLATIQGVPPPEPPALTSPANGAAGILVNSPLTWSSLSGAASYDVYYGTSSSPPFVANTTSTSYSPPSLAGGTTYYGQIVAKNGGAPPTPSPGRSRPALSRPRRRL